MRINLKNSRKPFVILADEINTLQLNLELERLRFSNMFDFSITVASNIDPEYLSIPPLLVQPFVENAILHGIMPKETQGMISIKFIMHNEYTIFCSIADNGVGRKKSAKVKSENEVSGHKSLGMQVTQERLEIFTRQTKADSSMNIIDLYDDKGIPSGTRVELYFPYEISFGKFLNLPQKINQNDKSRNY